MIKTQIDRSNVIPGLVHHGYPCFTEISWYRTQRKTPSHTMKPSKPWNGSDRPGSLLLCPSQSRANGVFLKNYSNFSTCWPILGNTIHAESLQHTVEEILNYFGWQKAFEQTDGLYINSINWCTISSIHRITYSKVPKLICTPQSHQEITLEGEH